MESDEHKKRSTYFIQKSLKSYTNLSKNSPTNANIQDPQHKSDESSLISKLQQQLDDHWQKLEGISCYFYKKKKIYCGLVHNIESFFTMQHIVANFKELGVDFDRERFLKILERYGDQIFVFLNNFHYDFGFISKMCQILEQRITVLQNQPGQLLGLNEFFFMLLNPVQIK